MTKSRVPEQADRVTFVKGARYSTNGSRGTLGGRPFRLPADLGYDGGARVTPRAETG